jgi:hypothetical protein
MDGVQQALVWGMVITVFAAVTAILIVTVTGR